MSSPFRAKVVIRGFARNNPGFLADQSFGTLPPPNFRRVTSDSGLLMAEVKTELSLRVALSERAALITSNPSPDGAWLLLELRTYPEEAPAAPWRLVRELKRSATWYPGRSQKPRAHVKFGVSHPWLSAPDQCRFANRKRLVEWIEVEIDGALEKGLLSER